MRCQLSMLKTAWLGHKSTMVVALQNHSGIPTVLHVSRGMAWTGGGGLTSCPFFPLRTPYQPQCPIPTIQKGEQVNERSKWERLLRAAGATTG